MSTVSDRQSQTVPQEIKGMSSALPVHSAARAMVKREAERSSVSLSQAIGRVASHLRVSPGSFGNVVRQRVKSISADLRDRIVAACIADLSREMNRLEHERQLLLAMGTSPRADDMDEVESALAKARSAIERMSKSGL